MTLLSDEERARAVYELARAYDTEDAAQMGEESPWSDPDALSDAEWQSGRLACAEAALTAALPIIERALAARFIKAIQRANDRLPGIEVPAMKGDNLAVILCSAFDDGGEEDDSGWSDAASEGYKQTIAAIREHYEAALAEEAPR